ncbi:hypothetical protein H7K06_12600 [Priestia aryabhattai]|uniref:hypothetical protein n=1 Tax=Priestia TaxID=2800373 RepID=UPI001C8E2342|nr:hypothetical protein [Priestia aryabhattai]MBX9968346.1 hypothetical protein [Priestia aryabhattai]
MSTIINFNEFQRQKKMKKFLRFVLVIGAISIFCIFAYVLIVTGRYPPAEYPPYIEAKP